MTLDKGYPAYNPRRATRNAQPETRNPCAETRTSLIASLGLKKKEHVALVGGGGKTRLLFALAGELRAGRKRVLASTTTKVWQREASQAECVLMTSCSSWREELRRNLDQDKTVFLGQRPLESGKLEGVPPSLLDMLYLEEELDYLLVEADGSAGHPVKAPSENEPVIPCTATTVVALMGVEVLGQTMAPSIVFRPEIFAALTGIVPGRTITPLALSRLFVHPEGLFKGTPASSRKMVFLNKADLPHDQEGIRELIQIILGHCRVCVERAVLSSLETGKWEASLATASARRTSECEASG